MNNDAISRSALIEQIRLMANRSSLGETRPPEISGIEVVGLIINSPAIDVAPVVHARWKDHHCTNCWAMCVTANTPHGFVVNVETPYCPNCGARMDGEAE